jgi:hypothetical protein
VGGSSNREAGVVVREQLAFCLSETLKFTLFRDLNPSINSLRDKGATDVHNDFYDPHNT